MKRIKLNQFFFLEEYIPQYLYETIEDKEQLIQLLDPRLLKMDVLIRQHFGVCTINNWAIGGKRQWSGVRTPVSPYYSHGSQHTADFTIQNGKIKIKRQCRASDKIISCSKSYDEIRSYIISNQHIFNDIKGIEMGVNWLHTDVRARETLLKFNK